MMRRLTLGLMLATMTMLAACVDDHWHGPASPRHDRGHERGHDHPH